MSENKFAYLRQKMVEEQLRPRGIVDERVLAAMQSVPRHLFVSEELRDQAYLDHPLPIPKLQTISQPFMVALMTQLLQLKGEEVVLEVGTGSGYHTAILAQLCKTVYSIEYISELAQSAERTLKALGYKNVYLRVGNGSLGLPEFAPYDRIIVTAGAPSVPLPLKQQIKDGGILVLPVGSQFMQTLIVIRREGDKFREQEHTSCVFVPLVGKYGWKTANNMREDKDE